jgi:hypothetical protein
MKNSDEAPRLNPWPFLLGDGVLLGVAALIAFRNQAPLVGAPLLAVASCVALGAVLACVPFLLNYTRRQDAALADRQAEIAALARTTAESAEQLGIAAAGLHTISDTAHRALKHADQLPHKLQEKISEFKTQLNEVNVTENETLAQEVNTLRASEIERLEATFAAIRKTAGELAALEKNTREHLAELNQSLARFSAPAERAAQSSQDTATVLGAHRAELERAIKAALDQATARWENAVAAGIAKLETRTGDAAPANSLLERNSAAPHASDTFAHGGEKSSKPPIASASVRSSGSRPPQPTAIEPPPVSERPPETSPVALDERPADTPSPMASAGMTSAGEAARKRPPRKSGVRDTDQSSLGLELPDERVGDEFSQLSPDETAASAVTADGLTRLLVTAYIGIGNKLFLRGEGPGLSWEKGVPLQFISIGKWRWETAEATAPLHLKLFKNDEHECSALGTVMLRPGHQQEVRASF